MATTSFTSSELELLTEALHRFRETKEEAHAASQQVHGLQALSPADFAIPQLIALAEKVDALHDLVDGKRTANPPLTGITIRC